MLWLLRPLSLLPLSWLHALGAALGYLSYLVAARVRARIKENVAQSGLAGEEIELFSRACARELGKALLETLPVWFGDKRVVLKRVRLISGWSQVLTLYLQGKGVIFLTPHLGCFEMVAFYIAQEIPFTAMYRQPKLSWLEPLMQRGRTRGKSKIASADRRGVRSLLKALKSGETIGLLPDQVPSQGEGIWADFWGRPAYTMSLVGRLQHSTGAPIVMVCAERLPRGKGYALHFEPLAEPIPVDLSAAAKQLNAELEKTIRRCPTQYLWNYNRYKVPAGVSPPAPTHENRAVLR